MTKRKIAVLAFIGTEAVLLTAALLMQLLGLPWPALLVTATAIGVMALALAAVWRRLEAKDAAMLDALHHLTHRLDAGQVGASHESADEPAILIGRAAGIRQPVSTSHREQERLLFGPSATRGSEAPRTSGAVAVFGNRERYDAALPAAWASDVQLVPGVLAGQAADANATIVLCDSAVFSEAPWNRAIDAAGTWLVQELERLKLWADGSGALLVFFDHADMPVGVNTATVRSFFHLVVSEDAPETVEGAPAPAILRELHQLHGALAAHRNGAGTL